MSEKKKTIPNKNEYPCVQFAGDYKRLLDQVNMLCAAHNRTVVMITDIHRLVRDMTQGGAGK